MRATPYLASLRIYEPLSAFDPADRLRWQNLEIDPFSFNKEEELALHRVVQPEPPAGRPDGVHLAEDFSIELARIILIPRLRDKYFDALDEMNQTGCRSVVAKTLDLAQCKVQQ